MGEGVRPLGVALGALALSVALGSGCGSDRPPPAGYGAGSAAAGARQLFESDAGGVVPPGCGIKPDGSACDCTDIPLFDDPPTIYFVLDRSGSMAEDSKWTQIRVVVGKIMRSLGPRANFGATMFPGRTSNCSAGEEVMSVRPGDRPSSSVDGPTTTMLLSVTRVAPEGGTSTSATLSAVRTRLANVPGRVFVILATDGAPNCNGSASCGIDQCQLNIENVPGCPSTGPRNCCEPPDGSREACTDGPGTLAEIAGLRQAQIPTYVVGLPGAAPYASLLDQMATAGGTALASGPRYFAVDAATEAVMLAALRRIAAKITATCTFTLRDEPAAPGLLNVYLDDAAIAYEPSDGWTLEGKTVTLVGSSCERVKSGDALNVRIIAGCPRLEPR